jgi:hypothetical protein
MDCHARFWVSIWLFSKLPFAKCPKCLNVQLSHWPEKYFSPNVWRTLAIMFGARRYRCMPCRHNFVSFRPLLSQPARSNQAVSAEDAPTEQLLAVDSYSSESPEYSTSGSADHSDRG